MTRKDYVVIAEAFRVEAQDLAGRAEFGILQEERIAAHAALRVLRNVALDLCQTFAMDNPRFDSARFLEASNLTYQDVEF